MPCGRNMLPIWIMEENTIKITTYSPSVSHHIIYCGVMVSHLNNKVKNGCKKGMVLIPLTQTQWKYNQRTKYLCHNYCVPLFINKYILNKELIEHMRDHEAVKQASIHWPTHFTFRLLNAYTNTYNKLIQVKLSFTEAYTRLSTRS